MQRSTLERRPPRLDLSIYPYLPRTTVETTSAKAYMQAHRRLASYRSREGGEFAFASDLKEKYRQLSEVEDALKADIEGVDDASVLAA